MTMKHDALLAAPENKLLLLACGFTVLMYTIAIPCQGENGACI